MDILLEKVGDKSFFLLNFLKLFSKNIYFLKINSKNEKKLSLKLKSLNVKPLPIAELKDIPYSLFSNIDFDPKKLLLKKVNEIHSKKISKLFLKKISNCSEKAIKQIIKDNICNSFCLINGIIDFWLKNKKKNLVFITYDWKKLIEVNKKKKLTLIYLPNDFFETVFKLFSKIKSILSAFLEKFVSVFSSNKKNKYIKSMEHTVAYILHGDTYYGGFNEKTALYNKSLYYSNKYEDLKKKNIIHFGYQLKELKNRHIKYKYLSDKNFSLIDIVSTLFFFLRSIFYIRKLSDFFFIITLTINLRYFYNCRNIFLQNPKLKIALIDYDFLCPKIIILALMSLNIKTAGVQERFITSFYNTHSVLIDDYFTPSIKMNEIIKKNESILAKNLIPVGMYRADKLIKKITKKNSKRIIVALGYQTSDTFNSSQLEMIINWEASKLFLEEMYRLSNDVNNCKIIIRLKGVQEYKNSYFKTIIEKIKNKKNIEINSKTTSEYSYKICSKANLVIAKHTSLADECISRNIPVIIHDYTHNMNGAIKGAFDYDNSLMICKNYSDILNRTKQFLSFKNNTLKNQFQNIKNKYYFYDKKITVKNKILNHLNNYLILQKSMKK
jgi:hypothetical protein